MKKKSDPFKDIAKRKVPFQDIGNLLDYWESKKYLHKISNRNGILSLVGKKLKDEWFSLNWKTIIDKVDDIEKERNSEDGEWRITIYTILMSGGAEKVMDGFYNIPKRFNKKKEKVPQVLTQFAMEDYNWK